MKGISLAAYLLLFSTTIFAHPGVINAEGGHLDVQTGEYHCHAEPCYLITGEKEENIPAQHTHHHSDDISIAGLMLALLFIIYFIYRKLSISNE